MTTTADSSAAVARLLTALADPDHLFTSDQVVFLMSTAARWAREDVDGEPDPLSWGAGFDAGYLTRVREENDAYPPAPIYDGQGEARIIDRVGYRRRCDREGSQLRRGDHRGGPVSEWAPDWCGAAASHRAHTVREPEGKFRCKGRS